MLKWLALFTFIPFIELALIIRLGQVMGILPTILLVMGTGFLGVWLARSQGFLLLKQLKDNLEMGVLPGNELLEGFLLLVGGIFLITPGLITDCVGFALLLPWSRLRIREYLKGKLEKMMREGTVYYIRRS